MTTEPAIRIDARGMRCPWPAILLAKALRDNAGATVAIQADDPNARGELAIVASAAGSRIEEIEPNWFIVAR